MNAKEETLVWAAAIVSLNILLIVFAYTLIEDRRSVEPTPSAETLSDDSPLPEFSSKRGHRSSAVTRVYDGYTWQDANYEQKMAVCRDLAHRMSSQRQFRWVTARWLYVNLEAYYQGSEPYVLRERVTDIAALCVALQQAQQP